MTLTKKKKKKWTIPLVPIEMPLSIHSENITLVLFFFESHDTVNVLSAAELYS